MTDMADFKAEYPIPDCLAPAAIETTTEAAGVTKASLPASKAFLLAMFAGAFIAFGGLFFTVFLSDPTLGWGAQRFVGGLAFCLGLVLVLICGAELFTGNSLMVCALKSKKDHARPDAQGLGYCVDRQLCRCPVGRLFGLHGGHLQAQRRGRRQRHGERRRR